MLMALMLSQDRIKVKNFVCSDLNSDLINLWNTIKTNPTELADYYADLWIEMNSTEDKEYKKQYFGKVRERLNHEHNPMDFLFIMRTTTNGMPRYNTSGEFNNSFHVTRDGINPNSLRKILLEWSEKLNKHNVTFKCTDFREIQPENENDFVYIDPPYAGTKGMYFGSIEPNLLFDYLRNLKCYYCMSYDGISGSDDNTYKVPEDVYTEHQYILSGNSSFKRTIGKDRNAIVYESLYIK